MSPALTASRIPSPVPANAPNQPISVPCTMNVATTPPREKPMRAQDRDVVALLGHDHDEARDDVECGDRDDQQQDHRHHRLLEADRAEIRGMFHGPVAAFAACRAPPRVRACRFAARRKDRRRRRECPPSPKDPRARRRPRAKRKRASRRGRRARSRTRLRTRRRRCAGTSAPPASLRSSSMVTRLAGSRLQLEGERAPERDVPAARARAPTRVP